MNTLPLVVASVLSIGVAVGAIYMFPPPQAESAADDSGGLSVATNADTLNRLERIEQRLEDLLAKPVEASAPVRSSLDPKQIEDAVAAYFARRGDGPASDVTAELRSESSKAAPKKRSPADLWAMFESGDLKPWELGGHMKDLSEAERREVVAMFKARAEEKKYDADAQSDYGHALIQKLLNAPIIEQAVLGTLADKQFDKALAIDNEHWGARFSKAMSLSNWPPMTGKQPEAIKQFEILINQQEKKKPTPQFEQSYLVLGNLYSSQGKMDEAMEVWQRGLKRFPNSDRLKESLKR